MLIQYEPFPQGSLSESTKHFVRLHGAYFYALHNNGDIIHICAATFCEHEKVENVYKFYRFHEWNSDEKPHEVTRIEGREIAMIFAEPITT